MAYKTSFKAQNKPKTLPKLAQKKVFGAFVDILSKNVDIFNHSPQRQLLNRSSGLFFETYSACSALFLDNLNHEIFSKKFFKRKFRKNLIRGFKGACFI